MKVKAMCVEDTRKEYTTKSGEHREERVLHCVDMDDDERMPAMFGCTLSDDDKTIVGHYRNALVTLSVVKIREQWDKSLGFTGRIVSNDGEMQKVAKVPQK